MLLFAIKIFNNIWIFSVPFIHVRNVWYEPDSPNPCFDVLYVIGIIFEALSRYSVDNTVSYLAYPD